MRNTALTGIAITVTGAGCGFGLLWCGAPMWLVVILVSVASGLPATALLWRSAAVQAGSASLANELSTSLARESAHHQATREFIQRILEVIPMPVYIKDSESRNVFVNQAQADQWGRPIDELIGMHSYELTTDEAMVVRVKAEDATVLRGERVYKEERKRHSATGAEQYRVITKQRCLDADGGYVIVCAFFDTTSWRQAEQKLQETLERETVLRERTQDFVQRLIDVIPDPFFIKDGQGRFVMINEATARDYDMSRESLIGIVPHMLPSYSRLADETLREDLAVIGGAEIDKEEQFFLRDGGEERFRNIIKRRCVHIDGSTVIVAAHFNITRWKVAERQLERIAHEDALTGLPNRRRFVEEAVRLMHRAERHGEELSLLLFDLDHFKQVNDSFGHVVGDGVLREIAERIKPCLRVEDLPCRWGGEEFAVLLPVTSHAAAFEVADRLREKVALSPMRIDGTEVGITVSCGVARWQSGEALEHFVGRADRALYEAKNAGRNTCQFAMS